MSKIPFFGVHMVENLAVCWNIRVSAATVTHCDSAAVRTISRKVLWKALLNDYTPDTP